MAFRKLNLRLSTGTAGLLAVGAILAASIGYAASGQGLTLGIPARNSRLNQQPRPESAPTGYDGNAVELTGRIEAWPLPRQPRPLSAVPKPLDRLVNSL